ncbi:hypothetical protein D3C84_1026010 [compost metagenome]
MMMPEQQAIIAIDSTGIRILRSPYVTPTPKPSKLTANDSSSNDAKCANNRCPSPQTTG